MKCWIDGELYGICLPEQVGGLVGAAYRLDDLHPISGANVVFTEGGDELNTQYYSLRTGGCGTLPKDWQDQNYSWLPRFVLLDPVSQAVDREAFAHIDDGNEAEFGTLWVGGKKREWRGDDQNPLIYRSGEVKIGDTDKDSKYNLRVIKYGRYYYAKVPLLRNVSFQTLERLGLATI